MRVTIGHTTKKVGIFKSAPAISLAIDFTDVERAAIEKSGLSNYVLYEPPKHDWYNERMQGPVRVSSLLKGPCTWEYRDIAAARSDEPSLREALRVFKENIDANAADAKQSDTFEL